MSQERERRERSHLQHEAEHSRPPKKGSVLTYLAILFGAAFLLLLLSYFMQQRASEETISGLTDNINSFQNVETLVEANTRLSEENKELTQALDAAEEDANSRQQRLEQVQDDSRLASKSLESMDWFWRIQRAYSKGNKNEAKKLAEQFEANLLSNYLPTTSTAVPDGPSPAQQYSALLSALGMSTAEP